MVINNENEDLIQEINDDTQLPLLLGRENKDNKEEGTFINLKNFTDAKTVSHIHAKINYDPKNRVYSLLTLGRNGSHIDGEVHLKLHGEIVLNDRTEISIGGFDMKFIYC